jgi:Sulfotransferase family
MRRRSGEASSGERVGLVYVMGAGHSGSTILGITLGNCDGFFYAGELEEWLMTAARPRWGAAERQDFWSAVKERVGDVDVLFGASANRCLERSSASFRIDRWPGRRRMRPAYRRLARELIDAVAEVSGARYVVDTSHFPLRARELRELPGIDLYLIYLVRDPRAVVASNTRELSPHELAEIRWRKLTMNANLWLTQLLAMRTFVSHPPDRRMFVRHEDFLADPDGITRQILAMVGSDAELPDLDALTVQAPLQGNQLIRAERVAVRRTGSSPSPRDTFTSVAQALWRPLLGRMHPAAMPVLDSAGQGAASPPRDTPLASTRS